MMPWVWPHEDRSLPSLSPASQTTGMESETDLGALEILTNKRVKSGRQSSNPSSLLKFQFPFLQIGGYQLPPGIV